MSFAAEKQTKPQTKHWRPKGTKEAAVCCRQAEGSVPLLQENTLLSPPWLPSRGGRGNKVSKQRGKETALEGNIKSAASVPLCPGTHGCPYCRPVVLTFLLICLVIYLGGRRGAEVRGTLWNLFSPRFQGSNSGPCTARAMPCPATWWRLFFGTRLYTAQAGYELLLCS